MAEIITKPARKISVRKRRAPRNPDFFCEVCGNEKEEELTYSFRDMKGERKKIVTCKHISTCANFVSTFG